jgi:hypothetical protein
MTFPQIWIYSKLPMHCDQLFPLGVSVLSKRIELVGYLNCQGQASLQASVSVFHVQSPRAGGAPDASFHVHQ